MLLRLSMCYIPFLHLWYAQSVKVLTCRVRDSLMQLHKGHALCAVLIEKTGMQVDLLHKLFKFVVGNCCINCSNL